MALKFDKKQAFPEEALSEVLAKLHALLRICERFLELTELLLSKSAIAKVRSELSYSIRKRQSNL